MSVLRGDKLRPSTQPKLGHLLTLHACICNLKNAHSFEWTLSKQQTALPEILVWDFTDAEDWQESHQQSKTILIHLWAPLCELGKNLLAKGAGWDLPSARVSQLP